MEQLLDATPAAFRAWARERIAELTASIDDVRGPLTTEQNAYAAEIVRQAKVYAFQLELFGLCDRLPAQEYKCAADALLRLREVVEWREPVAMPQNGRALTVAQAAEELGLSTRTVYDLITSGELSSHRVGNGRGRIRISPSDLDAYRNRSQAGFSHLFQ